MMQRVPFLHQFFQQRDFLRAGFANAFLHAPTLDIFPSGGYNTFYGTHSLLKRNTEV